MNFEFQKKKEANYAHSFKKNDLQKIFSMTQKYSRNGFQSTTRIMHSQKRYELKQINENTSKLMLLH